MARLPAKIWEIRLGGTWISLASSEALIFSSTSSSARISPGCMGVRAMLFTLMVVDNFNVMRSIVMPCKTDSPLVIDSDTELPLAVTAQCLEPVAGQEHERFEGIGGIKDTQPLFRLPEKSLKRADGFALVQFLGFLVLEAFDHAINIALVRETSKVCFLYGEGQEWRYGLKRTF